MSQASPTPTVEPEDVKWIALALGVLALVLWAMPAAVVWVHDGHTPRLLPSIEGTVKLVGHHLWAHPRSAYSQSLRRHMPTGPIWWTGAAWALGTLGALAYGIWHRIQDAQAHTELGQSSGKVRGSKPRSWARKRDLTSLAVAKPRHDRFTLGRIGGQLLASDPEAHVAVIAPTRSGKTTRYVIPWLLEHDGPAIVTSTKTDVLHATRAWRARHGRVWVWDPFGDESAGWTPVAGCEDWQHALAQAQWLADAAQHGDSEIAGYWRGEAARLLAPLLHAAALANGDIRHVLHWVDTQDTSGPPTALTKLDAPDALHQFQGICALDPRNRGSIYMSAGSLLSAYRLPAVQATAHHELTTAAFFDGKPNTLYLVASSRQQRLLAPLAVALISSLLHAAGEHANHHGPLSPTLRVLLDETANIAPLRDLPAHLSQAAGQGIRIATIWQSLAQARQRYGHATDDILANSTAKLYLGPVTDTTTRNHLTALLGDEPVTTRGTMIASDGRARTTAQTWRPKATAASLQQLQGDRALLIEGRNPPAVIRTSAWWENRQLRRRGSK